MLSVYSLRGRPIGRLIRVVEMLLNEVFLNLSSPPVFGPPSFSPPLLISHF